MGIAMIDTRSFIKKLLTTKEGTWVEKEPRACQLLALFLFI
jgi:hypothetical protein